MVVNGPLPLNTIQSPPGSMQGDACRKYTPSHRYRCRHRLAQPPVPSPERRDQILLNERCLLKGWTALHYVAAEGSSAAVATLLAAGASVNVHGAVLAGIASNGSGGGTGCGSVGSGSSGSDGAEAGTALQLARALLSKEGAGPRKKGLQEVARQLSAATQAVERAKEQRERKEREAKASTF